MKDTIFEKASEIKSQIKRVQNRLNLLNNKCLISLEYNDYPTYINEDEGIRKLLIDYYKDELETLQKEFDTL